ncbi:MAG: hypothetical protein ABSC55_21990, partial [Syntrophorhabdales bacterium]
NDDRFERLAGWCYTQQLRWLELVELKALAPSRDFGDRRRVEETRSPLSPIVNALFAGDIDNLQPLITR